MSAFDDPARETQRAFVAALLDPRRAPPDVLRHPQSDGAAHARFDVYRNNVMSSLMQALADKFPAVHQLLGSDLFGKIGRAYIRRHLPKSPVLKDYGDGFPTYLAGFKQFEPIGYVAEIARLEVALLTCFHAADHTPVSPQSLTCQQIEQRGLELAPSLQIIRSKYPIYTIYQFACGDGPAPTANEGESVLVYRDADMLARLALLPPGGPVFIEALRAGQNLARAAQQADQLSGDDLQYVVALLVHHGQICRLDPPPASLQTSQTSEGNT